MKPHNRTGLAVILLVIMVFIAATATSNLPSAAQYAGLMALFLFGFVLLIID